MHCFFDNLFACYHHCKIHYYNHHCKQYIPKKPKIWDYKIFVLTDDKGIVYNFDIYCGKIHLVEGFPDIGASGNIVLKLASIVPPMINYKLFFDSWSTNVGLVCELQKVGILSTSDIRDTSGPAPSVPCIRISLITECTQFDPIP